MGVAPASRIDRPALLEWVPLSLRDLRQRVLPKRLHRARVHLTATSTIGAVSDFNDQELEQIDALMQDTGKVIAPPILWLLW
jgi:hypothetical protein